jgi:hypothetical protein
MQSSAWTVGISREMDKRGCKQLQAEVDGLLGATLEGWNQQTCGQAKELVHQRTIRTILASREDVDVVDRGGGCNNVMRQLRRHAIGED